MEWHSRPIFYALNGILYSLAFTLINKYSLNISPGEIEPISTLILLCKLFCLVQCREININVTAGLFLKALLYTVMYI